MIKHPLLIKRKNFLADRIELTVAIPRENGFHRGIHQNDIDCFFAELGYAEALPMPLRRQTNELIVYFECVYELEKLYQEAGFAIADPLPYEVKDKTLIVLSTLSLESKKAGYAEALSVERNDIPF